MRCNEVQTILDAVLEGELPAAVHEHLSSCAACQAVRRDLWMMRAGFRVLAQETPPQASIGFSTRLIRRLGAAVEPGRATAEFIERIGRRFVLAGLLITMSLLLALALPSSSPLRGPSTDEPYIAQGDAATPSEVNYLADEFGDTHDAAPVNSQQGSGQTKK